MCDLRILLEMLKPINIEYTNKLFSLERALSIFSRQTLIHNRNEPLEHARVYKLADRVTDDRCLRGIQTRNNLLAPRRNLLLSRPLFKLDGVETEKSTRSDHVGLIIVNVAVVAPGCNLDIAEVEKRSEELEYGPLFVNSDADGGKGVLSGAEFFSIINSVDRSRIWAPSVEIRKFACVSVQTKVFSFLERSTSAELIENVIITLNLWLVYEARPFKEVGPDTSSDDILLRVKKDLEVFAEPGGIVVSGSLCISKGLENRVCREDLLLHFGGVFN